MESKCTAPTENGKSKERKKSAFADRFKDLRTEQANSEYEISKNLHISADIVSRWTRGLHEPTLRMAVMRADFFDISLDYLVGRQDF